MSLTDYDAGICNRETDFRFHVKQISTSSAAMVGITEKGPVNKPVLVTTWEQFINKFGSYINEGYLAYAVRAFFDNGGSILYVCRVAGVTDSDYIGDPSQNTGLYAFDEIDALNLLMVPGVTTVPVINAGIAYAEGRKDLLFIADTPMHLEPLEALDFRKGQGMYSHAAFNSSYAALYYPWLEIRDPVSSRKKLVPPCGAVAGCIARNDQKTNVWNAPAGIDRGRIFNAVSVAYKTSRKDRDVLYPEGVNVIAVFPDTGINIWGQRTLQSQPSVVDRINVRRLLMYIEEAISWSSRFVVFEPNNPQTWRALGRLISHFLQDIKQKGGVYDYAFQCDEETNTPAVIGRNEMIARVFVKPTKTSGFIELKPALKGEVEKMIEPKSYHEKKNLDAFLDFENSAIDVQDAVISFGNRDRSNLQCNMNYLTSNETKALCLSMVTYFKAYDPEFASQLKEILVLGKATTQGTKEI